MIVFRILLVFCARVLAAVGFAAAAMLLGWIITAHAANPVPDNGADRQNPVLCGQTPDAICSPDLPGLVTKPATLVIPSPHRAGRAGA
jgi:hypothetical protein